MRLKLEIIVGYWLAESGTKQFSVSESQESNRTTQAKNCVPLLYYDWLKKISHHFLNQSEVKTKN